MKAVKLFFILFSFVYLSYLALPTLAFPIPPSDALQSKEPADSETPLRRAYFTDLSREEVLKHYENEMKDVPVMGAIPFLTYRLNYPPEEAYGIIRDQTRSTFLEEIVHPFRESIYINGFEPKNEKDTIFINNKVWRQKITVRFVPSTVGWRLGIGVVTLTAVWLVYLLWGRLCKEIRRSLGW